MKKLLTLVLTFSLYFSPVSTQDLTGNYQIDSLVVTYVMVTRDMVQQLADGTPHIIEADDSLASYSLAVGWPFAGECCTSKCCLAGSCRHSDECRLYKRYVYV